MKVILRLASTALAVTALFSTASLAADLYVPTEVEPIYEAAGFDWNGLYAGVSLTGEFELDDDDAYFGGGVQVGVNYVLGDSFLLGLEGSAQVVTDEGDDFFYELFVLGRAGVLVTPDVLLYGVAGLGYEDEFDSAGGGSAKSEGPGGGDAVYQLGAGVEVAVTDDISLRGQLTGYGYFDDSDLFEYAKATIGINFHF